MPVKQGIPVQLAIQGGGAKLIPLIAALAAVEKLQDDGILQVKRIAGTSAGAIAGALFASGVRMETVRARLRAYTPEGLKLLFPKPSRIGLGWHLVRGTPLWSTAPLKDLLDELFQTAKVFNLEEIQKKTGIEMLVIAADLMDGDKIVYRDREKQIVNALLDSSALPLCFRVWSKGDQRVIVDGGICENFPVDELAKDGEKFGPIIGFSFVRRRVDSPTTFLGFSTALLDTAINNSIRRAGESMALEKLIKIDTRIGTFDFEKALSSVGLDSEYAAVESAVHKDIDEWVTARQRKRFDEEQAKAEIKGDRWERENPETLLVLADLNRYHEATCKFEYRRMSFVVQANCLLEPGDPGYGEADLTHYSLEFEPADGPIFCHSIATTSGENMKFTDRTNSVVLDGNARVVETYAVPCRDRNHPSDRDILLFFTPPLRKGGGPYKLKFTDFVHNLMGDLRKNSEDYLMLYPRRAIGPIGRIDLVVHVPMRIRGAKMVPSKDGTTTSGRPLNNNELLSEYAPPPGFYPVGWTASDISGLGEEKGFRADVVI